MVFAVGLAWWMIFAATLPVYGQEDWFITNTYPTLEEFAELPRYCVVQRRHDTRVVELLPLGGLTPEVVEEGKKWRAVLGEDVWVRLHHYCAGLAWINRYRRSVELGVGQRGRLTDRQRRALQDAVGQFEFMREVMESSRPPIYPEWAMYLGIAYRELGQDERAIDAFLNGIRFKKDFPGLYVELAELSIGRGQLRDAREILELGLENCGDAEIIREKLAEIGAR